MATGRVLTSPDYSIGAIAAGFVGDLRGRSKKTQPWRFKTPRSPAMVPWRSVRISGGDGVRPKHDLSLTPLVAMGVSQCYCLLFQRDTVQ